jgi:hypothetical protein
MKNGWEGARWPPACAPSLTDLPVEVEDARRPCPLVQIVDVLSDDPDVVGALQFDECQVSGVGLSLTDGPAAFVVEVEDEPRIPPPGLRARHLFRPVAALEAIGTAERLQPALGTDARPRDHHDAFHLASTPAAD